MRRMHMFYLRKWAIVGFSRKLITKVVPQFISSHSLSVTCLAVVPWEGTCKQLLVPVGCRGRVLQAGAKFVRCIGAERPESVQMGCICFARRLPFKSIVQRLRQMGMDGRPKRSRWLHPSPLEGELMYSRKVKELIVLEGLELVFVVSNGITAVNSLKHPGQTYLQSQPCPAIHKSLLSVLRKKTQQKIFKKDWMSNIRLN